MKTQNEKLPNLKELERELGDFLSKKFGNTVKVVGPVAQPQEDGFKEQTKIKTVDQKINFDLKPEDLIDYLDRFMVRQDKAKAILATKICTHFNRIKHARAIEDGMVGHIKNNVLMIGPTGVGKTYLIKLIAKKIGVPFVKGDATKFSETGYVGGDVEDLVRDLVREADGDIELAQYGIIYIDEIDKIASSHNLIGADVSRTGVQRALLKPLEETEVDLKVPHDPISMIQELERYRKTGDRDKQTLNTKHILFIVSGAFGDLQRIIKKRLTDQGIGFGANIKTSQTPDDILKHVKSEDLMEFGFESEFVGRLPVRAVFERLSRGDLYDILKNLDNPIILGKKLDFAAYGIDIKFDDKAIDTLAGHAYEENTGARGLVSAVEKSLLLFETKLPSTDIKEFPVVSEVIEDPEKAYASLFDPAKDLYRKEIFNSLCEKESRSIIGHLTANSKKLENKYKFHLTPGRMEAVAGCYSQNVMTIEDAVSHIKSIYDNIKGIELHFYQAHDINIVFEEDAIDFLIEQLVIKSRKPEDVYRQIVGDFELGLRLVKEKTKKTRFFITRSGMLDPESFISRMITENLTADTAGALERQTV
jgi:ATP-dependent Clp protease ATP-binding subunit ClpX